MSETNQGQAEQWQGDERVDGLTIVEGPDGWLIMPKTDGLPLDKCPCCDKPFAKTDQGKRAARLCADAVYPVAS